MRALTLVSRSSAQLARGARAASARLMTAARLHASAAAAAVPTRGVRTLAFGDEKEVVRERSDFPKERLQAILGKDVLCMLGYGPQVRCGS